MKNRKLVMCFMSFVTQGMAQEKESDKGLLMQLSEMNKKIELLEKDKSEFGKRIADSGKTEKKGDNDEK